MLILVRYTGFRWERGFSLLPVVFRTIQGLFSRASVRPVFVMLLILVASSSGDETSDTASMTYLEGVVRVRKPGSEGWLKVAESTAMSAGDSAKTLADSRAEIQLMDNDIIRIGSSTIIGFGEKGELTLRSGEIWTAISRVGQIPSTMIKLPVIIAEIREAISRFSVGEDGSTEIKVYNGQIDIRILPVTVEPDSLSSDSISHESADTLEAVTGEKEVLLGAGYKIIVTSGAEIVFHAPFGPSDLDEDTDWVRWNIDRDQSR